MYYTYINVQNYKILSFFVIQQWRDHWFHNLEIISLNSQIWSYPTQYLLTKLTKF